MQICIATPKWGHKQEQLPTTGSWRSVQRRVKR